MGCFLPFVGIRCRRGWSAGDRNQYTPAPARVRQYGRLVLPPQLRVLIQNRHAVHCTLALVPPRKSSGCVYRQ
uniref:Uncharacterized protein n=1 Tax=uncultured Armatimonadetes bacterium TaxID=157466 RepID=A0A6J4H7U4_9BACT|nr:hypothetical protein AVDCRST_MAG63-366 [uncultured Armatimonadetes bacterium]